MKLRLTVRTKLIATVLLPVLVLLALAFVSVRMMSNIEAGVETIYEDRVVPLQQLKTIADAYAVFVIDAVNKANEGMMSAEEALQGVREARREIRLQWESYLSTELTQEESRLVDEARTLFRPANADLDRLEAALSGLSGNVRGQLGDFNGPLYDSIDPISSKITELVDLQLRVAGEERALAGAMYQRSVRLFSGVTLIVVLLVALAGWYTYRSVAVPIGRMRETMMQMAADHDLSRRVTVSNDDEIGASAHALNSMLDQFSTTLSELRGMTEQLASAAEQLSAVSTQNNTNLDNQRSQTEQVATAMNEMTATVQEVARSAGDAAQSSQEADSQSRTGGDVVASVVRSIGQLSGEVSRVAESVQALDQQSQQIGSVLDVIRGIAEQTNLLALNAAIEAARAGEQGRGFAVVADEVRTLASRTQASTADIQAMIEALQDGTRGAVAAMNQGREMAESTAADAQRAGEALESIVDAVARIRDMTSQIASAAEQQNAVAEEINRNVTTINEITGESVAGANQTAGTSQELAGIASRARELVAVFRLA
ncbi:methyl-accepting chemotaxis protein [Thioalkalivibrio denitrificans]|uniref:Methyl-accepting chemotaxis protein n=1 Tax=Thioalkalivibrio denitrificans TaxID=108003 RepID=A0A1V3NES5_9GAMM|nr:methyl-accepting chemotaxis protein [Thioalkalivibrio denitrificans]OOG23619.1 methyl-accepting chemotaxis protein [Thioalkalivibrio denitrificans]